MPAHPPAPLSSSGKEGGEAERGEREKEKEKGLEGREEEGREEHGKVSRKSAVGSRGRTGLAALQPRPFTVSGRREGRARAHDKGEEEVGW